MSNINITFLNTQIVMLYGTMNVGGIETLIVRTANSLVSKGCKVWVFCVHGEAIKYFDPNVKVIYYSSIRHLAEMFNSMLQKSGQQRISLLSFDAPSAAKGLILEALFLKNIHIRHVSGVFHPQAYFPSRERGYSVVLHNLVARAIGNQFLYFMNEECRTSHAKRWRRDLTNCQVVHLPVNDAQCEWSSKRRDQIRIVSVGRLVDFKAYNTGIPDIIKECLAKGINVSWDVFGEGPLKNSIKSTVERLYIAQNVKLMGNLDYNLFSETVREYDIFVGMGTAALEAAMVGVPTICATINHKHHCYGYIYNLPLGNVGELQTFPPTTRISQLIVQYFESNTEHRLMVSQYCRKTAEKYSANEFIQRVGKLMYEDETGASRIVKQIVAKLYRFKSESRTSQALRRIAKTLCSFS